MSKKEGSSFRPVEPSKRNLHSNQKAVKMNPRTFLTCRRSRWRDEDLTRYLTLLWPPWTGQKRTWCVPPELRDRSGFNGFNGQIDRQSLHLSARVTFRFYEGSEVTRHGLTHLHLNSEVVTWVNREIQDGMKDTISSERLNQPLVFRSHSLHSSFALPCVRCRGFLGDSDISKLQRLNSHPLGVIFNLWQEAEGLSLLIGWGGTSI